MSPKKSKSAKKTAKKTAKKSAKKQAKKPARTKPARSQPESLRARRLSASLTASDLQKSLAWYRDVVGFTVEQRHEREGTLRAVTLKAGTIQIVISQDDGAMGERVKGTGFSLYFTTAQNVDELAAQIKKRGGILTAEPADMYGARVFRLQDPDGFKLVISTGR
jgi:predicted enzyme related to lactoylglutathione lyase